MDTPSSTPLQRGLAPHGFPTSTRDGWRSLEHRVLKRRSAAARPFRRRRPKPGSPVRDAFETWRRRGYGSRILIRLTLVGLIGIAAADVLDNTRPLQLAALVGAL